MRASRLVFGRPAHRPRDRGTAVLHGHGVYILVVPIRAPDDGLGGPFKKRSP